MKKILATALLPALLLFSAVNLDAGSSNYSSGRRSYSSGSSQRSGSSYSSGSRSYSGGSSKSSPSSSSPSRSYSSGSSSSSSSSGGNSKNYSSGSGSFFWNSQSDSKKTNKSTFDSAAKRATQEAYSSHIYEASRPPIKIERQHQPNTGNSGQSGRWKTTVTVPRESYTTRQQRMQQQFGPSYYPQSYAMPVYQDSFNPWFWMWLMNQNSDNQAMWAYNHRDEMDEKRYQEMLAKNSELAAKIATLEAGNTTKDPNYVPPGIDQDLIYADTAVQEETVSGVVTVIIILGFISGAILLFLCIIKK